MIDNKTTIVNKPAIISNGTHKIRIYTVVNCGHQVFQPSFYERRDTLTPRAFAPHFVAFEHAKKAYCQHDEEGEP